MKALRMLLTLLIVPLISLAQATGEVDYPYLGIKFTIPATWKGQEIEAGYIMGSDTEPGLILMMTHEATTLDQLKLEANKGIYEEGGTQLTLADPIEQIGHEGVGGHFSGMLEFNRAEAYITAVVNPFGTGVTIMAMTDPANYSNRQKELALEVTNSLMFAQPKESPVAKEWLETLKGSKLTYLSTSGGSDYSGYSGSSSREEILLCSDGSFSFYNSYSASFDIDAGFGSSNNSDSGAGQWKVLSEGGEQASLVLTFNDGRASNYTLEYKDEKTYLSGSRYFRTYDHGECR